MTLGSIFLVLVLLSFFFFILDGIIAPSEHMLIRFALFKTADEIDELGTSPHVSAKVVQPLKGMTYTLVDNMPRFNLTTLTMLRVRMERDEKFREEARARVAVIEECDVEEVMDVRRHIVRLADRVLAWNCIGWVVFLIPILMCAVLYERIQIGIRTLLTTPQKSLDKLQVSGFSLA
ncbi:MAG: hypothetical protein WA955_15600 [Diaphorobacter nitroreducens]|uniref:hypothetical protein n=1 Tax=Diaphorobacter nitroreducens TaxID=164759 RepID=UPI003C783DC4